MEIILLGYLFNSKYHNHIIGNGLLYLVAAAFLNP